MPDNAQPCIDAQTEKGIKKVVTLQ